MKKEWALYGRGLIGREIIYQLGKKHVAERLGLKSAPKYVVRSNGYWDAKGKKIAKPGTLPEVAFIALPSDETGKTARDYILPLLKNGSIVVTAEKSSLANYFSELKLASNNFKNFGINASVGGGVRIIQVAKRYFRDKENVTQVHMVLNGTLTSIFSLIGPLKGGGVPLGQAVDQAVKLGFAEPGAETPSDVIKSEASGDIPKKTSIFFNALELTKKPIRWQDLNFKISAEELKQVEEEASARRLIVSLYNTNISTAQPESGILGGFSKQFDNWTVVAGFRDVTKNPLLTSLGELTGPGNGIVIGLGPDESDGVISLQGQGAGPKPTVNTMLDDYITINESYSRG